MILVSKSTENVAKSAEDEGRDDPYGIKARDGKVGGNFQKHKVTNLDDGTSTFFFDHSMKSSHQHMSDYIARNKGKFRMKAYSRNTSDVGPMWRHMREVETE